jgi:hypothetical protein
MSTQRLSVPVSAQHPQRTLPEDLKHVALRIADVLVAATPHEPSPSNLSEYDKWLDIAVAARSSSFDELVAVLEQLCDSSDMPRALRELDSQGGERFHLLSSVTVGAYFLCDTVRSRIGYSGQRRDVPTVDEAVNDLEGDILNPVIDRGPIYVDPDQPPR